jgi:hypothetical protein
MRHNDYKDIVGKMYENLNMLQFEIEDIEYDTPVLFYLKNWK